MTGNKGGKRQHPANSVESWIAIHICAQFPLYHSKDLFVLDYFMIVLGVSRLFAVFRVCSRWFSVFRHTLLKQNKLMAYHHIHIL